MTPLPPDTDLPPPTHSPSPSPVPSSGSRIELDQRIHPPFFLLQFPAELFFLILFLMWMWDFFFEDRILNYLLGSLLFTLLALSSYLLFRSVIRRTLIADDVSITYREWMKETVSIPVRDIRRIMVHKPTYPLTSIPVRHMISVEIVSENERIVLEGDPLNINYYSLVLFMKEFLQSVDLSHVECSYPEFS